MAAKQYEVVAERLRQRVVHGELPPGSRLPNEATLAVDFGVSRATVREALRMLATQNLIRTSKGAGGGSYVTLPSVNGVSDFVESSITMLADRVHRFLIVKSSTSRYRRRPIRPPLLVDTTRLLQGTSKASRG
jgi:DNA-binding FadR family transcriptional regulator